MSEFISEESVRLAIKHTITDGWAIERDAIEHDTLAAVVESTRKFLYLPTPKRGTGTANRRINVGKQEPYFRRSHNPIRQLGVALSDTVADVAGGFDPYVFGGFRYRRAVVNRFDGSPGNPAVMVAHRDEKYVGRLITVLTCEPGQLNIEGKRLDVNPGDLMFLIGAGVHDRDNDYPEQPLHGARAENLRHSVAYIEVSQRY